jgi:exodeoxyribonuclease V gamma subunit
MPGTLSLIASNRLEHLCDELAAHHAAWRGDPMSPEVVVVQSRGMEQWLRLGISRRLGVCANVRFPFPNAFFAETLDALFPGHYDTHPYEREALTWRLVRLLPELGDKEAFAEIAAYLSPADGGDDARLYNFARQIADVFDQYLTYRPAMILGWESGEGEGWQPGLWREVRRDMETRGGVEAAHRARLAALLVERLAGAQPLEVVLPFRRVSVFGVSVLPPLHLEVLAALARRIDVSLYLMNPSRVYWSLDLTEAEKARITRRAGDRPGDLALGSGNSLLTSLGRLGRDFFDMIQEVEPDDRSAFRSAAEDTLLHVIQADILDNVDRGRTQGADLPAHSLRDDDDSVSVHACHSAMREAEVLRDYLLDLFDREPDLSPADVLVMTPDIREYAPVLQAVLQSAQAEAQSIPIAVADRSLLDQTGLTRTVFRILGLPEARAAASEVLALAGDRFVSEHFALGPGDIELMAAWVAEAGIRWGLDAGHQVELGLPAVSENTWDAGLDRLLLGAALSPPEGDPVSALYREMAPVVAVEGSRSVLLGKLADLVEAVRGARQALAGRYTVLGWLPVLRRAFEALLGGALETEGEAEVVSSALRRLEQAGHSAGGRGQARPVGVEAVRAALRRTLATERTAGRFQTGRLTICEMLPMRSIPAEVICLVGMNDGGFPRSTRPPSFDLTTARRQKGDRSLVDEDRYLFLETILSARRALYVSYVGQSIRDNAALPPAVPVSLLLDYIEQACPDCTRAARGRFVTKHPLQPFSPRHLAGTAGIYTYSRHDAQAARVLAAGVKGPRRFCPESIAAEPATRVDMRDLHSMLRNPARFFVRRRLGFRLDDRSGVAEDREPFVLRGLDRFRIGDEMLTELPMRDPLPAYRAQGRLPQGQVGELELEEIRREVMAVRRRVDRFGTDLTIPERTVALDVGDTVVEAALPAVRGGVQVLWRWGKLRAVDLIGAWLVHLAAHVQGAGPELNTAFVATDASVEIGPVSDAGHLLADLLAVYRQAHERPLPFYAETSLVYAEGAARGDPEAAIRRCRARWEPGSWSTGESEDPYVRLCFDGQDALDKDFEALAGLVYTPVLSVRRAVEDGDR